MSSLTHSGLALVPVRPCDEGAIRDWYELRRAVTSADQPQDPPPCPQHERGRVRHPWPGADETLWVARLDGPQDTAGPGIGGGPVIGGCLLQLPTLDNLSNAAGEVFVAPGYRRQGIGRALLAHLVTEAIRHGRTRLIAEVDQPLDPDAPDPVDRFAVAAGAVCALRMTRRRLDVGAIEPSVLADLAEQ
ncbi:MAG TPA: GNAT family N-acetyltransferase, partial [Pseudonocardiaceae bacterium]|nr:GNAT family N-acetyltransferase [Pseudonocardiaceae bacterium]